MSAPASPPLSVWEQRGLDAGAKLAWLGLRSFAGFGIEGEVFVWPSRAGLARRIGAKPEAVKKQVARLTKLGLVTRATRRIDGADRDGWVVRAGEHRPRGEAVPRVTQGPPQGNTLPAPGEAVPLPRVLQAPHTLQDQSNYQSREGDAPATRDPQPSENHAHEQDTHTRSPEAQPRGRAAGEVADRDGGRAGDTRAAAGQVRGDAGQAVPLNAHFDTTARRHADLAAERAPADARRLSPELWQVIEALGWEQQARAATWCERANESLERVLEGERPATLRKVLEAWDVSTHQGGVLRPKKSELWDWRGAKWREAVLGGGRPKGGMSGGIVASRPLPDWDKRDEERRAAR